MENKKLTDEQIKNWRKVLCLTLGAYTLIAPREQIQVMRDTMQGKLDKQVKVV